MDVSFTKPQKCAVKVPVGHILVNKRWRGSLLCKEIDTSDCRVMYSDGLGFVDFFPSDSCAVLYITEAELLIPRSFKERVQLLSKEYNRRGVIIADVCQSTSYQDFLDLACIDYELTVFPVVNQNEIPRILRGLEQAETRQSSNVFKNSGPVVEDFGQEQIAILKSIPNIGDKTALKLLKALGHIQEIPKVSEERLGTIVSKSDAKQVYQFFQRKVKL